MRVKLDAEKFDALDYVAFKEQGKALCDVRLAPAVRQLMIGYVVASAGDSPKSLAKRNDGFVHGRYVSTRKLDAECAARRKEFAKVRSAIRGGAFRADAVEPEPTYVVEIDDANLAAVN